ncbi:MAG TPA: DUF167 domain-containing protein [Candidatus Bathyarchaeia archaeon]|nr:DUF167 domain-containing protein [Candidatus Bathyarchaeia archaeon]
MILDIKVIPSSGRQICLLDKKGTLTCYLKNPPEQNKANHELIKLLATALKISHTHIRIIQGTKNRKKRVHIECTFSLTHVYTALGIACQTSCLPEQKKKGL